LAILIDYISKLGNKNEISIEYEAEHFKRPKDAGSLSAWQLSEFFKEKSFGENEELDGRIA